MKKGNTKIILYCVLYLGVCGLGIQALINHIEKNSLIMEARAFPYVGKHVVIGKDTIKILYYNPSWDEVVLEDGKAVSIKFLEHSKVIDSVEDPR